MKKFKFLFTPFVLAAFFLLTAMECEDPVVDTMKQEAAKALADTEWTASQVMWEGVDLKAQTEQYQNFTINFTAATDNPEVAGGGYTVSNSSYGFPATSGTWEFVGVPSSATSFTIKRVEEDVEMTVKVSGSNLELTFDIPEQANAKTNGTSGEILFKLTAN